MAGVGGNRSDGSGSLGFCTNSSQGRLGPCCPAFARVCHAQGESSVLGALLGNSTLKPFPSPGANAVGNSGLRGAQPALPLSKTSRFQRRLAGILPPAPTRAPSQRRAPLLRVTLPPSRCSLLMRSLPPPPLGCPPLPPTTLFQGRGSPASCNSRGELESPHSGVPAVESQAWPCLQLLHCFQNLLAGRPCRRQAAVQFQLGRGGRAHPAKGQAGRGRVNQVAPPGVGKGNRASPGGVGRQCTRAG